MATSSGSDKERALIKKYLSGNCTPEERLRVEHWYDSFDREKITSEKIEGQSIKRVSKVIRSAVKNRRSFGKVFKLNSPAFKVAALLALTLSFSLTAYYYSTLSISENTFSEIITAKGERKKVTLPDGTIVSLNAGSRLKVISDFKKSSRQVFLSGEAYFTVAKDSLRPFIVKTSTISTRVLGTAFNVEAYHAENSTRVAVAEGKVNIEQLDQTLTPGKQLVFDHKGKSFRTLNADVEKISAWANGTTYFENESIESIAKKLERKYNVTLNTTGNDKVTCRYTLHFSDESIHEALMVLNKLTGVTYKEQEKNQFIINIEKCK